MKTKNLPEWRIRVLARDAFICQQCGAKDSFIPHHIKSRFLFPNLATETDNGQTLCKSCHKKIPVQSKGNTHQFHEVMLILSLAVLPYQKRHLKELSLATKKPQSELAREALSFLFSQYKKMGY